MIASPPELCAILVHLIHLPLKGVLILAAGAFGGVHAQLWLMEYMQLPKTNILTTDMYIAITPSGQNSEKQTTEELLTNTKKHISDIFTADRLTSFYC